MRRVLMLVSFVTVCLMLLTMSSLARAAMALNPDVTQDTIGRTVCVVGWTNTVRPPMATTEKIKHQLMKEAGLPLNRAKEFELDHRVPLTLGGAPLNRDNLMLQSWATSPVAGWTGARSARVKDKLEVRLNKLVCTGKLPLAEAQSCIYGGWIDCYNRYLPKETTHGHHRPRHAR